MRRATSTSLLNKCSRTARAMLAAKWNDTAKDHVELIEQRYCEGAFHAHEIRRLNSRRWHARRCTGPRRRQVGEIVRARSDGEGGRSARRVVLCARPRQEAVASKERAQCRAWASEAVAGRVPGEVVSRRPGALRRAFFCRAPNSHG